MTINTLANSSPQNITVENALFCLIDEGCIPEFDSSYDEIDKTIFIRGETEILKRSRLKLIHETYKDLKIINMFKKIICLK